jgi:nitrogen-specific signal transduction histidine kinase
VEQQFKVYVDNLKSSFEQKEKDQAREMSRVVQDRDKLKDTVDRLESQMERDKDRHLQELKDLEERIRKEVTQEMQAQFNKQLNEYDAMFKTGFNNSFSARA